MNMDSASVGPTHIETRSTIVKFAIANPSGRPLVGVLIQLF